MKKRKKIYSVFSFLLAGTLCLSIFGVNPYQMLSTGALLIAAADGEGLVQKMALEGIPSAVIGRTTSGKERILRNGEEVRYLDKPQMDEMYRVGR